MKTMLKLALVAAAAVAAFGAHALPNDVIQPVKGSPTDEENI